MKLCGIGFDPDTDGFESYMTEYHKTKASGTFDDLDDELEDTLELDSATSEAAPYIRAKGSVVKSDPSISKIHGIHLITDAFCEYSNYTFEECLEVQRGVVSEKQGSSCLEKCEEMENVASVTFEDMPPIKQRFEQCLDDFGGPNEFFDYGNKTSIKLQDMLFTLRKNGFVVIKNFFPEELMAEASHFLNTWDEEGIFCDLDYDQFYSTNQDQLNEYENRLEIVLPFVHPFETVLAKIHGSILMELMSAYGNHQPINIDFPASIMSRPGALEQAIHSDHGYEAGMLKLNVAIHDIPEESGPTSFCPCTHQNGIIFIPYQNDCRVRYHPALVKAGAVTIYDQSMRHNGMANNGELKRRYILDLSYNIGNVRNNYTHSYPDLATEHIVKYRESYKNLNLVFN